MFWVNLPHYEPLLQEYRPKYRELYPEDYKKLFLMTAREIAQECQVSEPTIIRFTNDLGFSGYMEFVQYMKGLLHVELTSVERFLKASQQSNELTTIEKYCQNAISNLETLRNTISESDLKRIARTIHKAETVYVVGYRASTTLAYYFGYLLKKIRENVFIDTTLSWEIRDSIPRRARRGSNPSFLSVTSRIAHLYRPWIKPGPCEKPRPWIGWGFSSTKKSKRLPPLQNHWGLRPCSSMVTSHQITSSRSACACP